MPGGIPVQEEEGQIATERDNDTEYSSLGDSNHGEVGREDAITAPKTSHSRSCMNDVKKQDRVFAYRPMPPASIPEERPAMLSSSSFDKACMRALRDLENGERQSLPSPQIFEEHTIEAQLHRLDLKMDKLSRQMTECLAGLCAVHRKRHGHAAPHYRQLCGEMIPMGPESSHVRRSSVLSNPSTMPTAHSHATPGCLSNEEDGTASARVADVFRREARESVRIRDSGLQMNHDRRESHRYDVDASNSVSNSETNRPRIRGSLVSGQSISTWIAKRQRTQSPISLKMWTFLENPESSLAAQFYNLFMPAFILMSVALSLAHAIAPAFLSGMRMVVAEITIESAFFLEIITRFVVCPNRWIFFWSAYNIIDILSVLPLIMRVALNVAQGSTENDARSWEYVVLIGFVPAMRLLKTWRRFQQVHLLAKAFKLAFEALPVMLFIYVVVWLFFTAAIFVAEEQNNIETLGQAMWLTFCSMTASIFGDLYPKSDAGRIIISALVMISILYMAIPIGIIGTCFSEVWANRDQILLVERMRRVFKQNGFTAKDIPHLFSYFDVDNSGMLNWSEFKDMASILKLGLSEDRLLSLFQMFDDDGSGGIDDQEFCRTIFPEAHPLLYGDGIREERDTLRTRFTLMPWGGSGASA
mmetsp:Transcript_75679/g.221878  ORF Transcript_75679/g.221878 Transcript_75679/m.221878 type:complete len:643 (+) Transcript_75679:75-2003(+)